MIVQKKLKIHEKEVTDILDFLYKYNGMDFSGYRSSYIKRRIDIRLRANKIKSYEEYLQYLKSEIIEQEHLLSVLTVNVTEFFRDKDVWNVLKNNILNDIIKNKKIGDDIKIWSAGCADGAETYSLSIALLDLLGNDLSNFHISIIGTDIDKEMLSDCELGVYTKNIHLKNMDGDFVQKYFIPVGDDKFAISDHLRVFTEFICHNMATDAPLENIDLILCRNVMIYFTRELQIKVISNFHKALMPRGFLILGKVESIWNENRFLFEVVNGKNKIYQKA